MFARRILNIESTAWLLIVAIVFAYCVPGEAVAQAAAPSPQSQTATPSPGDGQTGQAAQPAQATQQPAASDSSAPQKNTNGAQESQQPVTTYTDPAAAQQPAPDAPQPKAQQGSQAQSEPQGAATAEKVNTAGGAAAKPAGVAIAPAKQHQARSLLIKIGAVVAAGAAAGTVYALSRGTSSTPPGSTSPGVVQKH